LRQTGGLRQDDLAAEIGHRGPSQGRSQPHLVVGDGLDENFDLSELVHLKTS
jgi:hypothetical protein